MANGRIRLALLGAGIYARDAHLPALQALEDQFEIAAIYSRTEASAQRLAEKLPRPPAVYTDADALLARPDIDAVDIVLPITLLPGMIEKALAAGKHVISEKPAAPDVARGRALLDYKARFPDCVWMVAENFRYEPAYRRAAALLREGVIGRITLMQWTVNIALTDQQAYYHTGWRQQPEHQGGYLFDVGVHHAAALRGLFGEIARVSGFAIGQRADLPPLDTLVTALEFDSGLLGQYAVSFASQAPWQNYLHIVGEHGVLAVERPHLDIIRAGEPVERLPMWEVHERSTITMLRDFAAQVRGEQALHPDAAVQAVQDVAVVGATLRAAARGQIMAVERVI